MMRFLGYVYRERVAGMSLKLSPTSWPHPYRPWSHSDECVVGTAKSWKGSTRVCRCYSQVCLRVTGERSEVVSLFYGTVCCMWVASLGTFEEEFSFFMFQAWLTLLKSRQTLSSISSASRDPVRPGSRKCSQHRITNTANMLLLK